MPSCLSAHDSALLSSLIRTNFDLSKTAFDHGLSIPELNAWLQSPHIQALATSLFHSSSLFLEIRLNRARMAAADCLQTVLESSDDPIERRRAASALLRRFGTQPGPPPNYPPPPPRFNPVPPLPNPWPPKAPSRREGVGGGLSSPSATLRPTIIPPPAPHPSPTQDPGPQDPGPPFSLGQPVTLPPCPPTQGAAPQDSEPHRSPHHRSPITPSHLPLASLLLHAFHHRDTQTLWSLFTKQSTPAATIDGRPLREFLSDHPLAQMHVSCEVTCIERSRSSTFAAYTFTFDRAPLSPSRAAFLFLFTREGNTPWLIHRIDTLDSS